jgi:hypothetical protein
VAETVPHFGTPGSDSLKLWQVVAPGRPGWRVGWGAAPPVAGAFRPAPGGWCAERRRPLLSWLPRLVYRRAQGDRIMRGGVPAAGQPKVKLIRDMQTLGLETHAMRCMEDVHSMHRVAPAGSLGRRVGDRLGKYQRTPCTAYTDNLAPALREC